MLSDDRQKITNLVVAFLLFPLNTTSLIIMVRLSVGYHCKKFLSFTPYVPRLPFPILLLEMGYVYKYWGEQEKGKLLMVLLSLNIHFFSPSMISLFPGASIKISCLERKISVILAIIRVSKVFF